MKQKVIDQFKKDFPKVFKNNMGISFCIGDGWTDILKEALGKIESSLNEDDKFEIFQVKEKFGGVRFYCSTLNQTIKEAVRWLEEKSYSVCEQCGAPGRESSYTAWIKTLCESCDEKRYK